MKKLGRNADKGKQQVVSLSKKEILASCREDEAGEKLVSSNNVEDSNVKCTNSIQFNEGTQTAGKNWAIGRKIGATFKGDDSVMIDTLIELEERDKIGRSNTNMREQEDFNAIRVDSERRGGWGLVVKHKSRNMIVAEGLAGLLPIIGQSFLRSRLSIKFRSISLEFDEEEIKSAVWSCATDKSPGPNDFNFKFSEESWDIIKPDIVLFVKEFQVNCKIPNGMNTSFIVLVPKVLNHVRIRDFRPISLSTFLGGRNILDALVILNEVIHSANNDSKGCCIFKVDFENAYNMRKWIEVCHYSTTMFVLINGIPTKQISISKGICRRNYAPSYF
ncbi:PREDICTED: uncharacterized protein LOC109356262 [Lupinus angustifolius]|uniref:uncharacterized protein LOC109356262 n=1 Tax=Lupinus angustifolius TaxID=3871 RepID=UPI00092FB357|nr:PREDICTED: uncharacterized protein LOC109356262 [Lupinus angustifolius]